MLIFPEPRRVSDSGSCVSYADRRWLVLPAEGGFELKEAAMCAAELLSELAGKGVKGAVPARNDAGTGAAVGLRRRRVLLRIAHFPAVAVGAVPGSADAD